MSSSVPPAFKALLIYLSLCAMSLLGRAHANTLESVRFLHGLQIRVAFPSSLVAESSFLSDLSLKALERAELITQLSLQNSTTVYFDAPAEFHNGLTTVIPRNRIFIQSEAPDSYSSVNLSQDYLFETLVHEWTHLLTLQIRKGIWKYLYPLFGNSSSPNALWPRWIHEGIAVWAEGQSIPEKANGRVGSGWIEFFWRQYAEYARRSSEDPLQNTELSGDDELDKQKRRVDPGSVPYAVGYSLIHEYEKKYGSSFVKHWVETSSYDLGSSFLHTLKYHFESPDILLEILKARAKNQFSDPDKKEKILEEYSTIQGPFRSGTQVLSWIQYKKSEGAQLHYRINEKSPISALQWPSHLGQPLQFSLAQNTALVLAYNQKAISSWRFFDPHLNPPKKLFLMRVQDSSICSLETPPRIREFFLISDSEVLWVRNTEDGHYLLETALIEGCKTHVQKLWVETHHFSRLSSPLFWNKQIFYSQSPERNSYEEEFHGPLGVFPSFQDALHIQDIFSDAIFCKNKPCYVFTNETPSYWGPLVWNSEKNKYYRFPTLTGSYRVSRQGHQWILNRSLWDKNELLIFNDSDLIESHRPLPKTPSANEVPATATFPLENSVQKLSSHELWPQFWTPFANFSSNGDYWGAQSFASTLDQTWQYQLTAAYNSSTQRGFLEGSVSRERWKMGPFVETQLYGFYDPYPDLFSHQIQNRWGMGQNLGSFLSLSWQNSEWILRPGWTLQYQKSYDIFLRLQSIFKTEHGQNENEMEHPLTHLDWGLHYESRWKLPKTLEQRHQVNVHFPIAQTTLQLSTEYGQTSPLNYPISYFEWGGPTTLQSQYDENLFLSRGYAYAYLSSSKIARAAILWALRPFSAEAALSWNRLRSEAVETRLFVENVSTNKLFRIYFPSAGVETILWGSFVQYIHYHLKLGVARGLHAPGETRIYLVLGSGLGLY